MTKIELNISEDLERKAQQRAAESGFRSLSEYLQSLVESDAKDLAYRAAVDRSTNDEHLEDTLISRLSGGPSVEATPAFWEELNQQFAKRQRERSAK